MWDAVAADVEHKVFWVEGSDPPTATTTAPTTSHPSTTSTTGGHESTTTATGHDTSMTTTIGT
jgi:hypothetical protein